MIIKSIKMKHSIWEICLVDTAHSWKNIGLITFYLLPTIEFFRDNINDDKEEYSYNISFLWLFWGLTFTKSWGKYCGRIL